MTDPDTETGKGMIDPLLRNESDLVLTPFVQTYKRSLLIDYSSSSFSFFYVLMSRTNSELTQNDLTDFFTKIDYLLYAALVLSFVMISLVNYLDKSDSKFKEQSISWQILRIAVVQSHSMPYRHDIIAAITSLFILCYFISTSFIKSTISVEIVVNKNYVKQIESMDDIVERKEVVPCLYNNSLIQFEMKDSKDPVYRELYRRIQTHPDLSLRPFSLTKDPNAVGNSEKFFDYVSDGKLTILELDYQTNYQRRRICQRRPKMRWHLAPAKLAHTQLAFAFRKGFDPTVHKKIDKILKYTVEFGIFNQWFSSERKSLPPTGDADEVQCIYGKFATNKITTISVINIKRSIFILLILSFISGIVLIFENIEN